jgi:hypothetical protein
VTSVISLLGSTGVDPFGYSKALEGWSKQMHVINDVKTGGKRLLAVSIYAGKEVEESMQQVVQTTLHPSLSKQYFTNNDQQL